MKWSIDETYWESPTIPASLQLEFSRELDEDERVRVRKGVDTFVDWDMQAEPPWTMRVAPSFQGITWVTNRSLRLHVRFESNIGAVVDLVEPVAAQLKSDPELAMRLVPAGDDILPPSTYELTARAAPRGQMHIPTPEQIAAAEATGYHIERRMHESDYVTVERVPKSWDQPAGFELVFSRVFSQAEQARVNESIRLWAAECAAGDLVDARTSWEWTEPTRVVVMRAFEKFAAKFELRTLLGPLSDELDQLPEHSVVVRPIAR